MCILIGYSEDELGEFRGNPQSCHRSHAIHLLSTPPAHGTLIFLCVSVCRLMIRGCANIQRVSGPQPDAAPRRHVAPFNRHHGPAYGSCNTLYPLAVVMPYSCGRTARHSLPGISSRCHYAVLLVPSSVNLTSQLTAPFDCGCHVEVPSAVASCVCACKLD
jgi:hypothetical protein